MEWNVLGVRAVALVLFWITPLYTLVAYGIGALMLGLGTDDPEPEPEPARPASPFDRRMDDLERRLAEFDRELERRG